MTARPSATSRVLSENRKARHDYHIEETFEAGLMLQGWEVKAIKAGQANFTGSTAFVRLTGTGALLEALTVTPLAASAQGLLAAREPVRSRTLLLNKSEVARIAKRVNERGYTVVPLALTMGRTIKVSIGLAKGKKQADKREALRSRDLEREVARQLASH